MKSKFIVIVAAVLLLSVLAFLAVPALAPEPEVGAAGVGTAVVAADLAVLNSIDVPAPVSAATAVGEPLMWLALGVSLVTITVVYRRRFATFFDLRSLNLRRMNDGTTEGTRPGGGPRDCISPAAA